MQKISFQSQGQRVDGTLFVPQNSKKNPGVIFLHGATSSQDGYIPRAQQLLERGIASLTVSLRGHGGTSDGSLSTVSAQDNLADVFAAYDFFMQQNGVDPERIGICATSFSAMMAAAVARERTVMSLVLRVPAAYTDEMLTMKMDKLLQTEDRIFHALANLQNTSIIRDISVFKGSLLVIASEKDAVIPITIPEAIIKAAVSANRKEFKLMKNAPHSLKDKAQGQEFTELIKDWFVETL